MVSREKIRLIPRVALFLVILLSCSPSWAAIDDAGAAHLKSLLQKNLDSIRNDSKGDETELVTDGELTVEPSGTYYAVTYPHLSLKMDDGSKVNIGMIAANIIPGDREKEWKVAMSLPSPITVLDASGKPSFIINIGKQQFSGIWNEAFESYTNVKAQYQDIIAGTYDKTFALSIADISTVYTMEKAENGNWSGPMDATLTGLKIVLPDMGTANIGKLAYNSKVIDYSFEAQKNFQEQMEALNESYASGEESVSPQHVSGLYNAIMGYMGTVWDGLTSTVSAENIVMNRPAIPGAPPGEFKLEKAGFSFDMTGFRKNQVSMRLALNYDGFSLVPVPKDFDRTTPSTVNLEIVLSNLPYKELTELGRQSLETVTTNPEASQMAGIQALMSLPQLMTQAGTKIEVRDIFLAGADYYARTTGSFVANLKAQQGLTGTGRAEIYGLETLISVLNQQSQDPLVDDAKKQQLAQTSAGLAMLQMVGQQGSNDKGQAVRTYDLVVNEQGQTLLNGTDINTLMQPQGQAPEQAQPPVTR